MADDAENSNFRELNDILRSTNPDIHIASYNGTNFSRVPSHQSETQERAPWRQPQGYGQMNSQISIQAQQDFQQTQLRSQNLLPRPLTEQQRQHLLNQRIQQAIQHQNQQSQWKQPRPMSQNDDTLRVAGKEPTMLSSSTKRMRSSTEASRSQQQQRNTLMRNFYQYTMSMVSRMSDSQLHTQRVSEGFKRLLPQWKDGKMPPAVVLRSISELFRNCSTAASKFELISSFYQWFQQKMMNQTNKKALQGREGAPHTPDLYKLTSDGFSMDSQVHITPTSRRRSAAAVIAASVNTPRRVRRATISRIQEPIRSTHSLRKVKKLTTSEVRKSKVGADSAQLDSKSFKEKYEALHNSKQHPGLLHLPDMKQNTKDSRSVTKKGHTRVKDVFDICRNVIDISGENHRLTGGAANDYANDFSQLESCDEAMLLDNIRLQEMLHDITQKYGLDASVNEDVYRVLSLAVRERLTDLIIEACYTMRSRIDAEREMWEIRKDNVNIRAQLDKMNEEDSRRLRVESDIRSSKYTVKNKDSVVVVLEKSEEDKMTKREKIIIEKQLLEEQTQYEALTGAVKDLSKRRTVFVRKGVQIPPFNPDGSFSDVQLAEPSQGAPKVSRKRITVGEEIKKQASQITLKDCLYVLSTERNMRKSNLLHKWWMRIH